MRESVSVKQTMRERQTDRSRHASGKFLRECRGACRALTLLEVILALTLMIFLLAMVFPFYTTVVRVRNEGGLIARDVMLTRSLLEEMAETIRHATDVVPGGEVGFKGTWDSITIVRTRMPELYAFDEQDLLRELPPPAQNDLVRIQYKLLWDPEEEDAEGVPICYGLWKSTLKTLDPNPSFRIAEREPGEDLGLSGNSGGGIEEQLNLPTPEGDLVAPEIRFVRFQYYDGAQWLNRWQSGGPAGTGGGDLEGETGEESGLDDEAGGLGSDASELGGGLSGLGGLGGGGLGGGGRGGAGGQVYALPQAVKITLGRERIDPEEMEEKIAREEEETAEFGQPSEEDEEHHPDRFTIVVRLLQSDPSFTSSLRHGHATGVGRQEGVR